MCKFVFAQSLRFIKNEGQWEESYLYRTYGLANEIFIEKNGITFLVNDSLNSEKVHHAKHKDSQSDFTLKYHSYKFIWLNANKNLNTNQEIFDEHYMNFFIGSNKNRWKSKIHPSKVVNLYNVYNNIDVKISSNNINYKLDYIIKPNSNYKDIQLQYDGINGISVKNGKLHISTSVGDVKEMEPYVYQYINGEKVVIESKYVVKGNIVSFELGQYNKHYDVVIDPEIVFASLTGSTSDNWGFTSTYDKYGNLVGGGIVAGADYPTSLGAFQTTFKGGLSTSVMKCDMAISKFSSDGTVLLFSTLIGGNSDEHPHSMFVDDSLNIFVSGKTLSSNFPTTKGAYSEKHAGDYDIFLLKLKNDGTDLIASTYIGGTGHDGMNIDNNYSGSSFTLKYNYGDNSRSEILLDKSGLVYLASCSRSSDFPVTSDAAMNYLYGKQDGLLIKMSNDLSKLIYSSYIGGGGEDAAYVIVFDKLEKNLFVAGGTTSDNFMKDYTKSVYQTTYGGGISDGFILKFDNEKNKVISSTYVGTKEYDQIFGIQVDYDDDVYVMGQTMGDFPVKGSVYTNKGGKQFLMKLDKDLSSNLASTIWGVNSGTRANLAPVAFLVDTCKHVYISGWGGEINDGIMKGLPVTKDAIKSTTDGADFYFIVFKENFSDILYATYFGSDSKEEHVDGGTSRFNVNGEVYQAICASCGPGTSSYPASVGAWSSTKGTSATNCNLGVVKIAFNFGNVIAKAEALPAVEGCIPFKVDFKNLSSNAESYLWIFDDEGASSTVESPTYSFNKVGEYNVKLVARNTNGCVNVDTYTLKIKVINDTIHADFNYKILDSCFKYTVDFTNTSFGNSKSTPSSIKYIWNFGYDDMEYEGFVPPTHSFPGPGSYTVRLIAIDDKACNSPDTIVKTITFNSLLVKSDFDEAVYCTRDKTLTIINKSVNDLSNIWEWGDGRSSTEKNVTIVFPEYGKYVVKLISFNDKSCNKRDEIERTITVAPYPEASFNSYPLIPELNKPTLFMNTSKGAVKYNWNFGDGQKSTEESPSHQFLKSGTYNVCLTATSENGCIDEICKFIEAKVKPLLDLPTAFTPNGDGNNDVLFLRGFGVEEVELKIYNRWGQLVFETNNIDKGWDGTLGGAEQPMDAYAYILKARFIDGNTLSKQGNVSLIR